MAVRLPTPPKFDLSAVVRSHGWASLAPFAADEQGQKLGYIAHLETSRVVELSVHQDEKGLRVEKSGAELGTGEVDEVKEMVGWMLGLEQDFSDFYDLVCDHPKLSHVVENGQGRILRSATVFEDTVKTILTTNTSWGGTKRMVQNLVTEYGDPLPAEPDRHAFPTPAKLAGTSEEELRKIGLGYRAPYVLDLSREVVNGGLDLEDMKNSPLSSGELLDQLRGIKGVGAYAAANLLMLLGRYDYLPVDSWARKMVSEEWYEGEPVGKAEVLDAFEEWGKWKGLAYWFWDWGWK